MTDAKPPEGWETCDGRNIDDLQVADNTGEKRSLTASEKEKLRQSCKLKDGVKLPDFRGCFLRGADQVRTDGTKPVDRSRVENGMGVGNLQLDAIRQHRHALFRLEGNGKGAIGASLNATESVVSLKNAGSTADVKSEYVTSRETRPVNYAVHWIIRVK